MGDVAAEWDCRCSQIAVRVRKRGLGCINIDHIILRLSNETYMYNLCWWGCGLCSEIAAKLLPNGAHSQDTKKEVRAGWAKRGIQSSKRMREGGILGTCENKNGCILLFQNLTMCRTDWNGKRDWGNGRVQHETKTNVRLREVGRKWWGRKQCNKSDCKLLEPVWTFKKSNKFICHRWMILLWDQKGKQIL